MTRKNLLSKRIFSIILSLAVALSMMPASAFADDVAVQAGEAVAEVTINGTATQYSDINDAFNAASGADSATVTLLADVTTAYAYTVSSGSHTLDLNGKTLTSTIDKDAFLYIENGGTLTIQDSASGGAITSKHSTLRVNGGGKLFVTGGSFTSGENNGLIVFDGGSAQLSGGTFKSEKDTHSIWVMNSGKAANLLAAGYRYQKEDGTVSGYSDGGNGVVGKTTVAKLPENEVNYVDADGNSKTAADCTVVKADTSNWSAGWYAVKEDTTISGGVSVSGDANLILCDGATLTIGGTLTIADDTTLNIYWQTNGSGKLTVKTVNGIDRITAPAGELKKLTADNGTTFEKCLKHDWKYTKVDGAEKHTAVCELCGKSGDTADHSYTNWESDNDSTHTSTCDCGATKTENHTLNLTANIDSETHSQKCSVCGYESAKENHRYDENGICTVCGTDKDGNKNVAQVIMTAENGTTVTGQYTDIAEAFKAAANASSATIKLLADVTQLYTNTGNVTIDLNGKTLTGSSYIAIVKANGGNLTIKDNKGGGRIYNPSTSNTSTAAVSIDGGTLTIEGGILEGEKNAIFMQSGNGALNISGGTFIGKNGYALLSYNNNNSKNTKLSGGTFRSTNNAHSIVTMNCEPKDILEANYRYMQADDITQHSTYGEAKVDAYNGKTVVGNTTVCKIPEGVKYIDKDEKTAEASDCNDVAAATTSLTNGWYSVKTTTELTSSLSVSGEVNLILCDGKTLTIPSVKFNDENAKLNLYWQDNGSGKLIVKSITDEDIAKITSPAGGMLQNDDSNGKTFAKCTEHEWDYTYDDGNRTRTKFCKKCGKREKAETAVAMVTASGSTGIYYFTVEEAFNATKASDGGTLTLLSDIKTNYYIEKTNGNTQFISTDISGTYTLDLNGHTVNGSLEVKDANSSLTIKDSKGNGKINPNDGVNTWPALTVSKGNVTIESGTFAEEVQCKGGALTIKDGTFAKRVTCNDSSLTINGGTFNVSVFAGSGSTAAITAGQFKEFSAWKDATVKISGGSFDQIKYESMLPSAMLAEGYAFADRINGKKVDGSSEATISNIQVVKADEIHAVVASVTVNGTTDKYQTFEEALSAAQGTKGSVLTLLDDITLTAQISIKDGDFVLDLNGKKLSGADIAHLIGVLANEAGEPAKLTIRDSEGNGIIENTGTGTTTVYCHGGDVTIEGGNLKKCLYWQNSGKVTIKGGTFSSLQIGNDEGFGHLDTWSDAVAQGKALAKGDKVVQANVKQLNEGPYTVIDHTHKCDYNKDTFEAKCSECGFVCKEHTAPNENGLCKSCGLLIIAYCGDLDGNYRYCLSLSEAFEKAKSGETIDVNKELPEEAVEYNYGDKSVKLDGLNGNHLTSNDDSETLTVSAGTLTIAKTSNEEHLPTIINNGSGYAVKVSGGTLKLEFKTVLEGGIHVTGDGKLEGGLPEGTILTGKISVEGSSNYNSVRDLLPEGYAFAAYNTSTGETGGFLDGSKDTLKWGGVIVAQHDTHNFLSGKCACGFVCEHKDADGNSAVDENGKCDVCKKQVMVAKIGSAMYETLQAAIAEANGADITLFTAFGENVVIDNNSTNASIILGTSLWESMSNGVPLTMNGGSITLKEGAMTQGQSGADAKTAIELNSGTLTVANTVTKIAGGDGVTSRKFAIEATGGVLDLQGNTWLDGGLSMSDDAQLATRLKAGKFTNSGSDTARVSVEGSNKYNTVLDLLADGYAFAEYNADSTTVKLVNGNVTALNKDVIVVEHTQHDFDAATGKCKDGCGTVAAATVQIGDGETKLYETFDEAWRSLGFDTKDITLTLLKDVDLIGGGTAIRAEMTLNMNGHSFGHAGYDFDLESGAKFTLTGQGRFEPTLGICSGSSLTVEPSVTYVGAVKIIFNTYGEEAPTDWSVALKGGTYGMLDLRYKDKNGNEHTAGELRDLLAPGYLFSNRQSDGDSWATDAEVKSCSSHEWSANGTCDYCNLVCPHENVTDGKCDTCKATIVAQDDDGKHYSSLNAAFNGVKDGGTVKLLADVSEALTISSALKLDCNGHTITTITVSNDVTLESLLPEGYAFKSNGAWVSDSELIGKAELDNVTNAEAPIKYVRADNPTITVKYGESYTLSTTFEWTGSPDSSDRLIKWAYKNESEFSSTVPTLTNYPDNKRTIDYSISTESKRGYPANAGTCTYVVTFTKDGYSKSCEFTVTIEPKDITEAMVDGIADQTYDGNAKTPVDSIKDGEKTLVKDKDYTVSYANNTNAGEATATITGQGNYTGEVVKKFTIKQKALSADDITVANGGTYDGNAKKPEVTVKDGDKTLKADTDYTLSYADNINAGENTAKVTVTGKGNYTGTAEKTFSIAKADYTGEKGGNTYVYSNGGDTGNFSLSKFLATGARYREDRATMTTAKLGEDEKELLDGNISWSDNTNLSFKTKPCPAGYKATLTIPVDGGQNYNDYMVTFTIEVSEKDTADVTITGLPEGMEYGKEFTLTATQGEESTSEGKWTWKFDSEIFNKLSENSSKETSTITLKAIKAIDVGSEITASYNGRDYKGSSSVIVNSIEKKALGKDDFNIPESLIKVYDGTAKHTKKVEISLKDDSKVQDSDLLTFYVNEENIAYNSADVDKANIATLTVPELPQGVQNYKFADDFTTIVVDASITAKPITIASATATDRTYAEGGSSVDVDVTFNELVSGETLEKGKGYTVSGTMTDDKAGDNKTVNVTVTLNNDNYSLDAKTTTTTVNIAKAAATCTAPVANTLTYNGEEQALVEAGTATGGTLVYSTEENGTYSETIPTGQNAGNYTVWYKVKGDENHNDTKPVELEVTIEAKNVEATVTVKGDGFTYNGEAHTPKVVVKDGNTAFNEKEYTVSYDNNINAGVATVTITDKDGGNYVINGSTTFTIAPRDIADATITLGDSLTYNGGKQTQNVGSVTATIDGTATTLTGADYTVSGNTATEAGNYKLTITGTGNFIGTKDVDFIIKQADQAELVITSTAATYGTDLTLTVNGGSTNGEVIYEILDGGEDKATIKNGILHPIKAGTIRVKATMAGNNNYNPVSSAETVITIQAATDPAIITDNATVTKGGSTVDLSKNVTDAKGKVSYAITGALEGCSIDEKGIFTSGNTAGTCTVTVTIAATDVDGDGTPEYSGRTETIKVAVSDKTDARVSFADQVASEKTYGDKDFVIKAKAGNSGENGSWTWSSTDSSVLEVSGTGENATIKVRGPGTATIIAKYESNTTVGQCETTIKVARRTISIKANNKTMTVNGNLPTFDVSCEGFVNGETAETVFKTQPTATIASDVDGKTVGKFDITVTAPIFNDGMDEKYVIGTIVNGILTVKEPSSGGGGGFVPIPPASEVTTDKTGKADEKATTSPAEVKNETKTDADGNKETISKITVSDANQKEIIKQVKDNKSGEIIIEVSEKKVADNAKLEISLDKDFIDSIVRDTDANLTIKTPEGDKTFTQEELKKLIETAEGGKVTIDSSVFEEPTEPTEPSGAVTPAQKKIAKGVKATEITIKAVRTKSGKIRLTWTKSKGYKVDYFEVYRSTKKNSGYGKKPFFTTKSGDVSKYLNTKNLKTGKTYYYKVRGVRVINGKKYYTEYSNKTWKKAK